MPYYKKPDGSWGWRSPKDDDELRAAEEYNARPKFGDFRRFESPQVTEPPRPGFGDFRRFEERSLMPPPSLSATTTEPTLDFGTPMADPSAPSRSFLSRLFNPEIKPDYGVSPAMGEMAVKPPGWENEIKPSATGRADNSFTRALDRIGGVLETPKAAEMQNPSWLDTFRSNMKAGVGDLEENYGAIQKWVGLKSGDRIIQKGQQLRQGHEVPMDHNFTWSDMADPNFYASTVARSLPSTLALAPAAVVGATVGVEGAAALGLGAFGRYVLGSLGGAALSAPFESAMEAGDVYKTALERGMTPDQANEAANSVFGKNLATLGVSNVAEFATAFAPIKGFKNIGALGKTALGGAKIAGAGLWEGSQEALQDVYQRQGLGDPVAWDSQMKEAFAVGGLMGAGLGGVGTVKDHAATIMTNVKNRYTDQLKNLHDTVRQEAKDAGMTDQQAEIEAHNVTAQTPQGQQIIQDVVEEIKQAAINEEIVSAPAAPSVNEVLYNQALEHVIQSGQVSVGQLQQQLGIGYGEISGLLATMESRGAISPSNGSDPREILMEFDEKGDIVPRAPQTSPAHNGPLAGSKGFYVDENGDIRGATVFQVRPDGNHILSVGFGEQGTQEVAANGRFFNSIDGANNFRKQLQTPERTEIPEDMTAILNADNVQQQVQNEQDVQQVAQQVAQAQQELQDQPTPAEIDAATAPAAQEVTAPEQAPAPAALPDASIDAIKQSIEDMGGIVLDTRSQKPVETQAPKPAETPAAKQETQLGFDDQQPKEQYMDMVRVFKRYAKDMNKESFKDFVVSRYTKGLAFTDLDTQAETQKAINVFYPLIDEMQDEFKFKGSKKKPVEKPVETLQPEAKFDSQKPAEKPAETPAPKQETKPSVPYKEGDRVTFERNGKTLTGTVKPVYGSDGYISVDVDQIATYGGGVPIGRIEMVWLTDPSLQMLEQKPVERPVESQQPQQIAGSEKPVEKPESGGATVSENEQHNGVEIRFSGKPSEEMISKLRARGFKYLNKKGNKLWYAKRNPQTLKFAYDLVGGKQETPAVETKADEPPQQKQETPAPKQEPKDSSYEAQGFPPLMKNPSTMSEEDLEWIVEHVGENEAFQGFDDRKMVKKWLRYAAKELQARRKAAAPPAPPAPNQSPSTQSGPVAQPPKAASTPVGKVRDNLDWLKQAEDKARDRLKSRGNRLLAGLPMDDLVDYAIIGASKIVHKGLDYAEWSTEMLSEFGDSIKLFLGGIYGQSQAMLEMTADEIEEMIRLASKDSAADQPTPEQEGESVDGKVEPIRNDAQGPSEEVPPADLQGTGEVGGTPQVSGGDTEPVSGSVRLDGERDAPTATRTERGSGSEGGTLRPDQQDGVGTDTGDSAATDRGGRTGAGDGTPTVRGGEGRGPRPDTENVSRRDFVITNELDSYGGAKTKFKTNVTALRALHQIEQEGRLATPEEQSILAKYVGWGGVAKAFDTREQWNTDFTKENWKKEFDEMKQLVQDGVITQAEYESARESALNAHYTAPNVVRAMYVAMERLGFKGGRILEPSMGTGNFFGLMPNEMTANSHRTGVEKDTLTGRIAKHLYQKSNIHIKPFENYKVADGYFDAAIGNVPFGTFGVTDSHYKGPLGFVTKKIHNYFFIKSLDKVRDGGLVMFITSSGTMNSMGNRPVRELMARKANLLAAIRLPSDAFKANAGTEVTTDIIILQKRPEGSPAQHAGAFLTAINTDMIGRNGKPMTNNEYFVNHPEMVLGKYVEDKLHGNRLGVASDGRDMENAIAEAFTKLPENVYQDRGVKAKDEPVFNPITHTNGIESFDDQGYGVVDAQLVQRDGDQFKTVDAEGKTKERILGMIPIRDAAKKVLRLQRKDASDAEVKAAQTELNKLYDAYVKKNDVLNAPSNQTAFKGDTLGVAMLRALEKNFQITKKGTGKKPKNVYTADKEAIFSQRTVSVQKAVESVETSDEALVVSLFEKGKIDFEHMTKLTDKSEADLIKDLDDAIFYNPNGRWETADEYLSGNVRQKLMDAEQAAKEDAKFHKNVDALKAIQPEDLVAHQVSVRLGAPWVPVSDMEDFVHEFLETRNAVKVKYIPQLASWKVEDISRRGNDLGYNTKNTDEYGVKATRGKNVKATDIIENALNLRQTTITWTEELPGGQKKTHVDVEATNQARNLQRQIQEIFADWIWSNEARAERLLKKYNWEYNNTRLREFDGEMIYGKGDDISNLPGINPSIKLRKHQKNGVWRVVQGGNTLLAHVVGAGKTWTMVAAAMEMKRLGLVNKPLFAVPNHLLEQWEKEFKELYPGATVLTIANEGIPSVGVQKRKEYSQAQYDNKVMENRARRATALSKIAVGNYDAILVTHQTFQKFPMSPQAVQDHIREQLEDLEIALEAAAAEEGSKGWTVKQLENAKKNLEEKLKANLDEDSKDVAIPFEELGVDQIFVDESHMFKNLKFHTKMRNVAGLPQTASKRAQDMYLKTRWLTKQRGGKGVVFATGTPISNTMAEMYTIQRYLQMDELRDAGLAHFDAWAALFGESVTGTEMDATGKFRQKTRFARFHNVGELMSMFRSFADIQTADMIDLPGRPKKVNRELVLSPISEDQSDYLKELADRALAIKNGLVAPEEDNYLKLTGDGRKAALDIRMVRSDILRDNPDSKVNKAVENIVKIWRETETTTDRDGMPIENLAQLVFLDLGTPKKKKETDSDKDPLDDDENDSDENNLSVYQDMKAKLVKAGIPEKEISFIHDAKTKPQKEKLFKDVKAGRVRVLIGSTEKMGAGMNVQERLIALHHLDAPWRPSDVEQREGRIVRQGNKNDPVNIYTYTTEGSFDALMWDTLKRKATFIAQVMNGSANVRSVEDVEELVMGYAQIAAITTGNPLVLEKFEVDQKALELQSLRTAYERNKRRLQSDIAGIPGKIASWQEDIRDLTQDTKIVQDVSGDKFKISLQGTEYTDKEEAGTKLIEIAKDLEPKMPYGEKTKLGSFAGFELYALKQRTLKFHLKGSGDQLYDFEHSDSPTGTASRLINALDKIGRGTEWRKTEIERLQKEMAEKKELLKKPFDKEQELKDILQRQGEILKQLTEENGDNNANQADAEEIDSDDGDLAFAAPASNKRGGNSQSASQGDGTDAEDAQDGAEAAQNVIKDTMHTLSPKAAENAAETLAQFFDTVVRRGHVKRRAEGVFNTKNKTAAVKDRSFYEWRVVGHELGHVFSDYYNKWSKKGDKDELVKLYEDLYPGEVTPKKQAEEGFAEFFRLWVVDPAHVEKIAPKTKQLFEELVGNEPRLASMLSKVRTIVDNDLALTPMAKAMGSVSTERGVGAETYGEEYHVPLWRRATFATLDYTIPAQALMKAAFKRGWVGTNLAHLMAISGDFKQKAIRAFESIPRDHEGRFIGIDESLADTAQRGIDMIGQKIKWKRVKIKGMDSKQGAFELFSIYLVAKRVQERLSIIDQTTGQRKFETLPMPEELARDVVNYMQSEFPDLEKVAEKFTTNLSRVMLDKLVAAGVITDQDRINVQKGSSWYVPFIYDHGKKWSLSGKAKDRRTNKNPIHRFKAETAPVLDFYHASMLKLAEVEQAIEYKRMIHTAAEILGSDGPGGLGGFGKIIPAPVKAVTVSAQQIWDTIGGDMMVQNAGNAPLTLFVSGGLDQMQSEPVIMDIQDGKAVYIQLAPDLFQSFMSMKPVMLDGIAKFLARVSSITRATALFNLKYMANAAARDIAVAMQQSKAPTHSLLRNMYDGTLAALRVPTKDAKALVDAYIQSGGHSSSAVNVLDAAVHGNLTGNLLSDVSKVKRGTKTVFTFVIRSPHHALRVLEEYPRLAEWKAVFIREVNKLAKAQGQRWNGQEMFDLYLQKGTDALPQAVQREMERILTDVTHASAEVTVNFRLHGTSEALRRYLPQVPFLHGQSQGLYRFSRQMVNKQNIPRNLLSLASISMLSILSWMLMSDDEDRKKQLLDMDSTMRDKYWFFPGPNGTLFAIAKPFEYALAANMLERFIDHTYSNDPQARKTFDDYGKMLKNTLLPDLLPSLIKTSLELWANQSSLGGAIVPQSETGLAKDLQAGPYTSQFAIGLARLYGEMTGDPKTGVSPRKIDYFVKSMLGGWGNTGLKMYDKMVAGVDRSIDGAEYGSISGPFLYGQAEGGSRGVDKFYKDVARADSLMKSANDMARSGVTDRAPAWITPESLTLLKFLPALNSFSDDLSDTRKEYNALIEQANPTNRRMLTLQLDYIEKLVAGLPYAHEPEAPHPDAQLTDANIQYLIDHYATRAGAAMEREATRKGGATEGVAYLEWLMQNNKKK